MPIEVQELTVQMAERMRNSYFGKYRGLVKNVDDPLKIGRVTARVPEIYGDEECPWALPAVPFAGKNHGLVLIPEVNDGVWIEFEAGDISRPIWTGFWWASDELDDVSKTKTRALITTEGHRLVLDDDKSEIRLLHSKGAELKMTADDITLKIGGTEIKLTKDDMTLKSGSGKIKLSAAGVDINNGAMKAT
ncbi:MAG TPA: phage baseplate assembly protein V [Pyrinomonadaceae bacterium]|jgi:uncharacterized protein involved in type VI secretion and phage assembly